MSETSCPAKKSWKLRCCKARKRVDTSGKFLRELDAARRAYGAPQQSRCRARPAIVNRRTDRHETNLPRSQEHFAATSSRSPPHTQMRAVILRSRRFSAGPKDL